ncbi:MAG TPA: Rrf2 family transcriptional regulator [Mycobacteriales bacterium]|nr:Rrf2 family transcriptional regulator [Mycobacteriales bacterium]
MAVFAAGTWQVSAYSDYALRALVEIASAPSASPLPARVIAEHQQIPALFLNNILADLRRGGLIASKRGLRGGWSLTRPADQITVADVLGAIDRRELQRAGRAVRRPRSSIGQAIDELWCRLRASVEAVATTTTLRDLVAAASE